MAIIENIGTLFFFFVVLGFGGLVMIVNFSLVVVVG